MGGEGVCGAGKPSYSLLLRQTRPELNMVHQVTSMKGARGAFSSPACSLWPYKFVSQLLATILSKNLINLQTHTPVTSITTSPSNPTSSLIHTSRGVVNAKKLVFATNAYTPGILPSYTNKIIPTLGTAYHLTPSPKPISPHLSNTYNITYGPARVDYLNPRPDGGHRRRGRQVDLCL